MNYKGIDYLYNDKYLLYIYAPFQKHNQELPPDLKLFYQTFNGFSLEWNVEMNGEVECIFSTYLLFNENFWCSLKHCIL